MGNRREILAADLSILEIQRRERVDFVNHRLWDTFRKSADELFQESKGNEVLIQTNREFFKGMGVMLSRESGHILHGERGSKLAVVGSLLQIESSNRLVNLSIEGHVRAVYTPNDAEGGALDEPRFRRTVVVACNLGKIHKERLGFRTRLVWGEEEYKRLWEENVINVNGVKVKEQEWKSPEKMRNAVTTVLLKKLAQEY